MPATFERADRAITDGFTVAVEEGRDSSFAKTIADALAFAEAFICAEGHADSTNDLVAKAVADTEEFPNTQTFSLVEA